MEWMEGGRWDLWIGGCQLLLGVLILARLHRAASGRNGFSRMTAVEGSLGFEGEILLQSLRQQTERSLWRIRAVVEAEQARLEEMVRAVEQRRPASRESAAEAAWGLHPFRLGEEKAERSSGESRYAQLVEEAAAGCSLEEAAQRSGMPLEEAELALKVRRAESV